MTETTGAGGTSEDVEVHDTEALARARTLIETLKNGWNSHNESV